MVYTNFNDVAKALKYKIKSNMKKEKTQTCPNCENEMRNIAGTNVWICDWAKLEDKTTKNGNPVQVFTVCGNQVVVD